jgi:hypothetical protein
MFHFIEALLELTIFLIDLFFAQHNQRNLIQTLCIFLLDRIYDNFFVKMMNNIHQNKK